MGVSSGGIMPEWEGSFLVKWAGDIIFFSGDVKTTTIAIAITSSLCCSIVYWLMHMFGSSDSQKAKSTTDNIHLRKFFSGGKSQPNCAKHRRSSSKNISLATILCSNCSSRSLDRSCAHFLCAECCHGNRCGYHGSKSPDSSSDIERQKPKEVILSYAGLDSWPERLGYLGTQLQHLDLGHNKLTSLPEEIGCLLGLEELYLQNNQVTDIPESIKNLTKLKDLDLSGNCLLSIPNHMCNFEQLCRLNVTDNALTSIPSTINRLHQLEELVLCSNDIKTVPKELCDLKKLKNLSLSKNPIKSLPSYMGKLISLERLDINQCSLAEVPPSIIKCEALVCLSLSNNLLTHLPDQIGNLKNLKDLDVSHNQLPYLPYSLVHLTLGNLRVESNPLLTREAQRQKLSKKRQFPSLGEISATVAARASWETIQELPYSLREMLIHPSYCCLCGQRLFMQYDTHIEFVNFNELGYELPLLQVICSNRYCVDH